MKRRNFVQKLFIAPALPAAIEAGQTQEKPPTHQPNTPPLQPSRQPPQVPKLELTAADLAAQDAPHFFTTAQFATLEKLAAILLPPLKNKPGAVEAKAPQFLDFLISESSPERQKLYLSGLDQLEAQAKGKFGKPFCDLESTQAGQILKPLLVTRPWAEDFPSDPMQNFIAQVHQDLRTATTNSREWAGASEASGRRFTRGFRTSGYYWHPIDPISGE
ncbi:MAG TPA: gluconate 2-dehydrogenase subunit 3 family protein [Bryobacteraceae bacterium]